MTQKPISMSGDNLTTDYLMTQQNIRFSHTQTLNQQFIQALRQSDIDYEALKQLAEHPDFDFHLVERHPMKYCNMAVEAYKVSLFDELVRIFSHQTLDAQGIKRWKNLWQFCTRHNMNINAVNSYGHTAIFNFVSLSHINPTALQIFIDCGGDIDFKNHEGKDAISYAIGMGSFQGAFYLLEHKASYITEKEVLGYLKDIDNFEREQNEKKEKKKNNLCMEIYLWDNTEVKKMLGLLAEKFELEKNVSKQNTDTKNKQLKI